MEDGHVDIGQKVYLSRRCLRFFHVVIRPFFVNLLSLSSVLRCCPSLMSVWWFTFI